MPGDEVHGNRGGPDRIQITDKLLNAIWELNEKTLISVKSQVEWPLDIKLVKEEWGSTQPLNGEPWFYPNAQTTVPNNVDDAESIRKYFGLYHVKNSYIGVVPWTFQTSENAGGDPYTDLDAIRRPEVMITYPGTDGPIPTPEYEAVREGIDDGKYAYVLEARSESARNSSNTELQNFGLQAEIVYQSILNNIENATLEDMDTNRETILSWILQLYGLDNDGDGIPDDGDGNGIKGDNPCIGGIMQNCDDNCMHTYNPGQEDVDNDGVGDVCDPCLKFPARIAGVNPVDYFTIQAAYDEAASGNAILSHDAVFMGDLNIDLNKVVFFEGGYNCDYSAINGKTAIDGKVTISNEKCLWRTLHCNNWEPQYNRIVSYAFISSDW